MSKVTLLLIVLPVLSTTVHACFFKGQWKAENNPGQFGSISGKDIKRTISTHSCVCGEDYPGEALEDNGVTIGISSTYLNQKWILYTHVKVDNRRRRCVGTIVNSNMVLTSHRCLEKGSLTVNEVFRSRQGLSLDLASGKDITLSSELDLNSPSNRNFTVKSIIYSERFAYDQTYEVAPESDVAILVVDFDFTQPPTINPLSPICLPRQGQFTTKELLNREGYYQGIRRWDGVPNDYNTGIHNFSRVETAEDCNRMGGLGVKPKNNETLCLSFTVPGPTVEGGPLRIVVKRLVGGGVWRSFLIGLANWVDKSIMNAKHKYAYFANINSFVKYVEHHAEAQGSTWCSTPVPHE